MSYILEALRKADQERSAGSVPDLEAVHESSAGTGSSLRWIWILAVILVLNGLLLAGLLAAAVALASDFLGLGAREGLGLRQLMLLGVGAAAALAAIPFAVNGISERSIVLSTRRVSDRTEYLYGLYTWP